MNNKINQVREYALTQSVIELPFVQHKFSLTYSEVKEIMAELVKEGAIEYISGISYRVLKAKPEKSKKPEESSKLDLLIKPDSSDEKKIRIQALWTCIQLGFVSNMLIQKRCRISYDAAESVIAWMRENGYIKGEYPAYTVAITPEEFEQKFVKNGDGVEDMISLQSNDNDRKIEPIDVLTASEDELQKFYVKALRACIEEGKVSPFVIQTKCNAGYLAARRALDWMEFNRYIGPLPDHEIKITMKELDAKFGTEEPSAKFGKADDKNGNDNKPENLFLDVNAVLEKSREGQGKFEMDKFMHEGGKRILWECIKEGKTTVTLIQERCKVGYIMALRIMDWMINCGYTEEEYTPNFGHKMLLDPREFLSEYGACDYDGFNNDMCRAIILYDRRRREGDIAKIEERRKQEESGEDDETDESEDALRAKGLWVCIQEGYASASLIQTKLSWGYTRAARILDWMESKGYIERTQTLKHKVKIDKAAFLEQYGKYIDKSEDKPSDKKSRLFDKFGVYNADDKTTENKDEKNSAGEKDADKDVLVKMVVRKPDEVFEDKYSDEYVDFKTFLCYRFERSILELYGDNECELNIDEDAIFRITAVNSDKEIRISDGGKTLKHTTLSKREITDILKNHDPVKLENFEIAITIDRSGEFFNALFKLYAAIDAVIKSE